jgi:hypothetical protein
MEIGISFSYPVVEHVSSQLFAVYPSLKILFSCGHWDHTFKATSIESGRLLQSITAHKDAVTCLTLISEFGRTWLINDGPRKGLEAVLDGMIEDSEGERHAFNSPIRSARSTTPRRRGISSSAQRMERFGSLPKIRII